MDKSIIQQALIKSKCRLETTLENNDYFNLTETAREFLSEELEFVKKALKEIKK